MYKASAFLNGEALFLDEILEIISPIDGSVVGSVPRLGPDQISGIFDNSLGAFSRWSKVPYKTRSQFLLSFASKLREHAPVLSRIVHLEVGKDLASANDEIIRSSEYIVESVHAYCDMMEKPETYSYEGNVLVPKGITATYVRLPIGVVLTISPFNYPVNLMITKVVPAILVGNTVVHKSATNGSLSGWYIAKLFNELSVDGHLVTPGVLNYVTCSGSEFGKILPRFRGVIGAVSFTGSTGAGEDISGMFPGIPMQLEMGGLNAAIVLKDADLNSTIDEIFRGMLGFSGQRCTSIKRVFVHEGVYGQFKEILGNKFRYLPKLKEPLIGDMVIADMRAHREDAVARGATALIRPEEFRGNYVSPMVLLDADVNSLPMREELFAPVLAINSFKSEDEVVSLVNDSKYGLQASIFTGNIDVASRIALGLEVGRVNINKAPSRSPDILPFLGIKSSGLQVQGIKNSLYFFTVFRGIVLYK